MRNHKLAPSLLPIENCCTFYVTSATITTTKVNVRLYGRLLIIVRSIGRHSVVQTIRQLIGHVNEPKIHRTPISRRGGCRVDPYSRMSSRGRIPRWPRPVRRRTRTPARSGLDTSPERRDSRKWHCILDRSACTQIRANTLVLHNGILFYTFYEGMWSKTHAATAKVIACLRIRKNKHCFE